MNEPNWREIAYELADRLESSGHDGTEPGCRDCAAVRRYDEAAES